MTMVDNGSPVRTEGQLQFHTSGGTKCPKGEAASLTKQGVTNPHPTPNTSQEAGSDGTSEADQETRPTVVQFSLLFDGDEEKFAHLWAMRDSMHRQLNAAYDEWRRADKVPSKRNPEKETFDRGPVTAAVKAILRGEQEYWAKQLPIKEARVVKLQVDLGQARAKDCIEDIERFGEELAGAQREVVKARVRSEIGVPSSVYDSVVQFTKARHAIYKKEAFRGSRSADSFTAGQPIRWRDGSWALSEGDKRGSYRLELELSSDGKKIRHGIFNVIPDGPSMYGFAKMMVSGNVKLCDARVVYSEKKKQWFAKLTIKYERKAAEAPGTAVAALRRGVQNAFVLAFDNGRVEFISGGDVLNFKRKLKARKVSISKHKDRLEAGPASRGRGKAGREKALRKINDAENRFIDWRCKTWAANIAKICKERNVGTLLVSAMSKVEMSEGNEFIQALLYQWPFARMLGHVTTAVEKAGISVKEYVPYYNARRCPNVIAGKRCGHVHAKRQSPTFTCEVCGFERPSDQIVAWNGLIDAVGLDPIKKSATVARKIKEALASSVRESNHAEAE